LYLLERRGYDVVSTTTLCFGLADGFFDLKLAPDLQDMLQANHLTTVAAFRRELWERAGGFHDVGLGDAYVFEDWKLWQRFAALGARMTNIRKPLFRYRMHSPESLSRQSGDVRALAAHQAAVASFNADVITPNALAESTRRRDMEITVEGAFENLRADGVERPTVWLALPFTLTGGAERLLSAVTRHLVDAGLRVIITTTVPVDPGYGDSTPWFEEATKEIYHLPDLLRPEYWSDFLDYLVDVKKIDVLLVAGSDVVYRRLPDLRDRFPELRVADLLFNTEGHVANNRRYRDLIDLHLCESHAVRDWLLESGEDLDSVITIESGIDVSRYRPRKRRREFPLRVGFSGRLSEEKAPLKFVELARLVPDPRFHFVMTGAGPLSEEVRLRAQGLGADRFSFLGVVEDIRAHIASLDILVLPSIVDGRPMVVLEALASGVPVVASRVGGLPGLVRDGETGFLVDPGDLAAIAGHLRRLADDPGELERIRLSARAFAEAHLSAERMLRAYECVLSGLATSRGRRMERERG
jgi:O-antigen biosynthesis protein